ncbi:TIR domain-containing protein [Actinosynnema sp. NPDC050801]|uniref:WD40 repeat domain-containing protein n=1 Tax=unclassified Actinosynnema TaxID=2637065 RepID=UPI0034007609
MTEVFISYSRRQQVYARALAGHLRERGVPVWMDDELISGDRWEQVIKDRIDGCAALVVVMTPDAEESAWVRRELSRAQDRGKTVFPLLLEGEVFFRLADVQAEDVRGGAMPGDRFVRALLRLVGTPEAGPVLRTAAPAAGRPAESPAAPAESPAAPRLVRTLGPVGTGGRVASVAFRADGTRLLAAHGAGTLREWDVATGRLLHDWRNKGFLGHVEYAFDGHLAMFTKLWSQSWNRVVLWDAAARVVADRRFKEAVTDVAWDGDTGRCVVVSGGHRVTEWSVRGAAAEWQAEHGSVHGAFYRPDHGLSLFSTSPHDLVAWDAATGTELLRWDQPNDYLRHHVGPTWFAAVGDREARIWSSAGGLEHRCALPEHPRWRWYRVDPLRRWLAVPGEVDDEVHLLSLATGGLRHVLRQASRVYRPEFSPDGSTLAAGDDKGRVHVWRL